jgi:hypothetical protein
MHAAEKIPEPPSEPEVKLSAEEVTPEPDHGHMMTEESFADIDTGPEPIKEDELAAFQSAIFGGTDSDESASPEDLLVPDKKTSHDAVPTVEVAPETETSDDEDPDAVFELEDPGDDDYEKTFSVPDEIAVETPAVPEPVITAAPGKKQEAAIGDADAYISEGKYTEAFNVYRAMLTAAPDDKRILQRMEELRQFLKMIGKDKEALIGQLNNFMEGINKNRDEFFRNS